MKSFLTNRITLIVAGLASIFTVAAMAAPAASAGDTPSPTPTVTEQGGHHHHFLRPEQWDVNLADDLVSGASLNDVSALGPVRIIGGTDINVSDVLDQFADGHGNDVNVNHPGLSLPVIDNRVCEATISQQDQRWTFRGGTGLFRRAFGFGVYNLNAEFSFLARHGRCSLGSLTPAQVLAVILAGAGGNSASDVQGQIASFCHRHRIPTPVLLADDIFVQGTGVAAVPHRISIFTPTASPTETVASG